MPSAPALPYHLRFLAPNLLSEEIKLLLSYANSPDVKEHPLVAALKILQVWIAIHPMPDGNGRLGMLLANWYLMKHGYPPFALDLDTLDSLSIFTHVSIKENDYSKSKAFFASFPSGFQAGIAPTALSPGAITQAYAPQVRPHPTSWFNRKFYEQYIEAQIQIGERLLAEATANVESSYALLPVSNPNENIANSRRNSFI